MWLQIVLAVFIGFLLLSALLLFFVRYQARLPYYQIDRSKCVALLQHAVQGTLLENEWCVFIGMQVRNDEEIEQLRLQCFEIDEQYVINTIVTNGKTYMVFSKQGIAELQGLLDEWQNKVEYLA